MQPEFIFVYPPSAERAAEFPVGGLFLSDALAKRGYGARIICDKSMDEICAELDALVGENTVGIGLSVVSTLIFRDVIRLSHYIKNKYPKIPFLIGGQSVIGQKEQILEFGPVDFVVVGDGEKALPDLLDALRDGTDYTKIVGLGYKRDGKLHFNGVATTELEGVYELPYHLLDVERYVRNLNIGGDRWLGAIYSRGCPYRCTFCVVSTQGSNIGTMRYHSLDHVLHDLKILTGRYKADAITVHDDHFLINQARVKEFCRKVLEAGIEIDFRANGRIDSICRMEEETVLLLRRAGFVNLIAGIETGSPRFLDIMKKKLTLDQVHVADKKLTKYGFYKHWNFMCAMPGETMEDVGHTLWLIAQLAKTAMTSSYPMSLRKYIPLPGTVMYEQAVKEYGFQEPKSFEEWADLSQAYISERAVGNAGKLDIRKRPWLSPELGEYVQRGEDAVEDMNNCFVGETSDWALINSKIKVVEDLALEAVRGKTQYPCIDYNPSPLENSLDETFAFRGKRSKLQRTHAPMYAAEAASK
ncbi:MAG TPA: radical SAM protein [Alphaproteobacteria bacterium]|nr:radical SAM protein [Alphaproteobacteria bacterium]